MKTNSLKDDLKRNVWCLMGLPVDSVTMPQTIDQIDAAIRSKRKLFLTTPNLNFVIGCQSDEKFRDSVIQSDLVIADGMPLIWIAKLLNIPMPERVSGSNVIEQLLKKSNIGRKYNIFYFGGQDNVAAIAEEKTAKISATAVGVGSISPGFVSTTEMSQPGYMEKINKAHTDILIVALGAKKGQEWIIKNLAQLEVPIISHLGAVVNFVAGTVKRSPVWMQKTGLEWIWRIKEEKTLYKRYWNDGIHFMKICAFNVLPQMLEKKQVESNQLIVCSDGGNLIIDGCLTVTTIDRAIDGICTLTEKWNPVAIDLKACQAIDSRGIGLILMLKKHYPAIKVIHATRPVAKRFEHHNAMFLIN